MDTGQERLPSPGALLKAARIAQELPEQEVAERLNWLDTYVAAIEHDDYQALARPAFARGYVQAYCRMLGLDEAQLLAEFDALRTIAGSEEARKRSRTRPLQLQRTGVGVVIGLGVLCLLVLALWWWQGGGPERGL